jgi:2-polyprenyl-3-methyl-5-hydroxy-6-metoxy-1,4-benzoquinol methylase
VKCRYCTANVSKTVVDLGTAPPSNAYLSSVSLRRPEKYFPLRVLICTECWLVQAEAYSRAAELFNDEYAYFSSFSAAWLEHARDFVDYATNRFGLGEGSFVVEVGANDGYLLQYFLERGVPCLGIEPTASTARAARMKGVPTVERFFDGEFASELRSEGKKADLMIANNVLAHVPDIRGFCSAHEILLNDDGVATFEFPHLMSLVEGRQFDTIYHEHFSYLSFTAVVRVMGSAGLRVFDVVEIGTHGGSLRVFVTKLDSVHSIEASVGELLEKERRAGVESLGYYEGLMSSAVNAKHGLLRFLLAAKERGERVVGYGAAAKGNTLLNFAGVRRDLVEYVVDRNTYKQGKFLPGSQIPIVGESAVRRDKPDYVLVLPWNLMGELANQLSYVREWGGRLVTAVPEIRVW